MLKEEKKVELIDGDLDKVKVSKLNKVTYEGTNYI